jgi:UDP-glucose 4-epimerase
LTKVLVTGGAGFIGSHLCDLLVAQGDEVIVLDDLSSGHRGNLRHLDRRVGVIEDSVLRIGDHLEALAGVSLIYHLAALISGHDSLTQADNYLETNVTGLLRVIECARHLVEPRIVYASSSTVYGDSGQPTRSEATLPAPITPYALSKLAGEHLLAMYAPVADYEYVSLRLFNVYGPRQSPDHPYANVTCKFAFAAVHDLPVDLYGDGQQSRDFIYVSDVVDALRLASGARSGAVYNVGTGSEATILSLLERCEKLSGNTLDVRRRPPWKNDIRRIRADISQIRSELGFEPTVTLDEGLALTMESFRSMAST